VFWAHVDSDIDYVWLFTGICKTGQ